MFNETEMTIEIHGALNCYENFTANLQLYIISVSVTNTSTAWVLFNKLILLQTLQTFGISRAHQLHMNLYRRERKPPLFSN